MIVVYLVPSHSNVCVLFILRYQSVNPHLLSVSCWQLIAVEVCQSIPARSNVCAYVIIVQHQNPSPSPANPLQSIPSNLLSVRSCWRLIAVEVCKPFAEHSNVCVCSFSSYSDLSQPQVHKLKFVWERRWLQGQKGLQKQQMHQTCKRWVGQDDDQSPLKFNSPFLNILTCMHVHSFSRETTHPFQTQVHQCQISYMRSMRQTRAMQQTQRQMRLQIWIQKKEEEWRV